MNLYLHKQICYRYCIINMCNFELNLVMYFVSLILFGICDKV